MTWKGVGSFHQSRCSGESEKLHQSSPEQLLLLEHTGAKFYSSWWWVVNENIHGQFEVMWFTEALLQLKAVLFELLSLDR